MGNGGRFFINCYNYPIRGFIKNNGEFGNGSSFDENIYFFNSRRFAISVMKKYDRKAIIVDYAIFDLRVREYNYSIGENAI